MPNKLAQQFTEIEAQWKRVRASKKPEFNSYLQITQEQVNQKLMLGWEVRARHLLETACGPESQHFKHFEKAARSPNATSWEILERMSTVFLAAKEDFEGGYLTSVRGLVQAEVYDSELDQASELLKSGYKVAAAVIAGTVLETSLRELCDQSKVPHGKIDKMNADLAKQGVYNANMAKRITALAAIRNSAAHGKGNEFTDGDVTTMVDDIARFLSEYLK